MGLPYCTNDMPKWLGFHISRVYSLRQDLSHGTIIFDLWPWPWSMTYFWKTLALVITFLPEVIGFSYCTCVFPVTRPFTWYHNFWLCDLDLEVWPTFGKLQPLLLFSDGCRPASVVVFWQLFLPTRISPTHMKLHDLENQDQGHFLLITLENC